MEQRRTAEFSCKPSPDQGQKLKNGHPTSPSRPSLHRRHPVLHEGNPTTTTTTTIADTHISPGHRERPAPMTPTHRAQREQHNLVRREKPLRSAFGAGLYADTDSPGKPAKPLPSTRLVLHGHPSRPLPEDRTRPRDLQSQTPKFRAARAAAPPQLEGRWCCLPGRCAAVRVQGRQQMGVIFSRSLSPSPLPHHRRHPFIPRAPRKTGPNDPHPSSAERATQPSSPGETSPLRIRRWTVCGHPFSGKAGQAPSLDPVGPLRPSKQAPP